MLPLMAKNTIKVANILTENQVQSFINSSILCALLVGIETLDRKVINAICASRKLFSNTQLQYKM
jgi:hypothetical protein